MIYPNDAGAPIIGGMRSLPGRFRAVLMAHPLAAVIACAVFVRLAVFALFPSVFAFDQTGVIHGSSAYDTYARNLLETGVYGKVTPGQPDAHLPPLYSYFLAGLYGMLGRSALVVAAAHIALDAASIAFLYGVCRRLFPSGRAVAALAGLFYALYPYLIFQNLTLIDTPLFMALLYAFLYLAVIVGQRARMERTGWILAALCGCALGLTGLVRPNAAILAGAVALWMIGRAGWRAAFVRLLPVACFALLTLAPWIARNYAVFGRFVPVALNGGENFYQGNNAYTVPYFQAGYDVQWVPPPEGLAFDDPYGIEANNARMQAGLDYLRQNPAQIPQLLWTKFLVHWSIDIAPARNPTAGELERLNYRGDAIARTDETGDLTLGELPPGDPVGAYSGTLFDTIGRWVHRLYYGALFALALVGIGSVLRAPRDPALLIYVQIAMTIAYVLFHPSTRYRAPTDPLLFAFSAYALVILWQWVMRRRAASGQPAYA